MKTPDLSNPNFNGAKLFIIDNNDDQWPMIQRATKSCLAQIETTRAATVSQALIFLEAWCLQEWDLPKLILLDLYMPHREDGWYLIQQIKSLSPCLRSIPLISLTSSTDPNDIRKAYQLGVSACLTKPTDFKEWRTCFQELRRYWWETASLPPLRFTF